LRAWGARVAAPAAFLLAVTVAFLLVRSALRDEDPASKTVPVSTVAAKTTNKKTPARRPVKKKPKQRKQFYVIESGDTFGTVADKFDTTVERLQELNPDASTTSLVIGQRIRVK